MSLPPDSDIGKLSKNPQASYRLGLLMFGFFSVCLTSVFWATWDFSHKIFCQVDAWSPNHLPQVSSISCEQIIWLIAFGHLIVSEPLSQVLHPNSLALQ